MSTLSSTLHKILQQYHDYVHNALMFGDAAEEILGFDEYAEAHHGVEKETANEFFYAEAAA